MSKKNEVQELLIKIVENLLATSDDDDNNTDDLLYNYVYSDANKLADLLGYEHGQEALQQMIEILPK